MSQKPELLREEPVVGKDGKDINKYGKKVVIRFYRDADGKERDFMVWGNKAMSAMIIPFTKDKKIIALEIFRRGANDFLIEIPGGNNNIGESMKECARRELLEETGYVGKIIRLSSSLWIEPASYTNPVVPFLAFDCEKVKKQKLDESESGEGTKICLIKLTDWFGMIYRKEIRDSKTIALTFLSLPYLGIKLTLK